MTTTEVPPLARRIADAMPQHARASLALAAFDRATRVPAAPVTDVENVITSAVETVLAGGSVDVDALAAEAAAAASEGARLATRHEVVQRVRLGLLLAVRDAGLDEADRALDAVRDEITEIVATGRVLLRGVLSDVEDGDAAIAADVVTEWRSALMLAARYRTARQAQRDVVRLAWAAPDISLGAPGGSMRAVIVAVPHRRDVDGVTVRYGHLRPTGSRIPRKPNPNPILGYPWSTDDPLADLRYAAGVDGVARVAWVPSISELGAVVDAAGGAG